MNICKIFTLVTGASLVVSARTMLGSYLGVAVTTSTSGCLSFDLAGVRIVHIRNCRRDIRCYYLSLRNNLKTHELHSCDNTRGVIIVCQHLSLTLWDDLWC